VFADATLDPGAELPIDASHEERALYVVSGEIDIMGDRFGAHTLLVLRPGDPITLKATVSAHLVIVGGAPMDGPRYIWWNFVSSRQERIDAAKAAKRPLLGSSGRDRVHSVAGAQRAAADRCEPAGPEPDPDGLRAAFPA
jgi:hypothetical protein